MSDLGSGVPGGHAAIGAIPPAQRRSSIRHRRRCRRARPPPPGRRGRGHGPRRPRRPARAPSEARGRTTGPAAACVPGLLGSAGRGPLPTPLSRAGIAHATPLPPLRRRPRRGDRPRVVPPPLAPGRPEPIGAARSSRREDEHRSGEPTAAGHQSGRPRAYIPGQHGASTAEGARAVDVTCIPNRVGPNVNLAAARTNALGEESPSPNQSDRFPVIAAGTEIFGLAAAVRRTRPTRSGRGACGYGRELMCHGGCIERVLNEVRDTDARIFGRPRQQVGQTRVDRALMSCRSPRCRTISISRAARRGHALARSVPNQRRTSAGRDREDPHPPQSCRADAGAALKRRAVEMHRSQIEFVSRVRISCASDEVRTRTRGRPVTMLLYAVTA